MSTNKLVEMANSNTIKHVVFDGQYGCQFCDECVDEAKYFPDTNMLLWKCENNHISSIEEFL